MSAENCQTGASTAGQQAEADEKELVLDALDEAVTGMRRSLGESLASIAETDTPLRQATTSSLELKPEVPLYFFNLARGSERKP